MSNEDRTAISLTRKLRVLNSPQRDRILDLLLQIPYKISLDDVGSDGLSAMRWIDEALDEVMLAHPRAYLLQIFMREAGRCASREPEVTQVICTIIKLLDEADC